MTYALTAHPALLTMAAGPYAALTVAGTIAGIAAALPLGASAVAIAHTGGTGRGLRPDRDAGPRRLQPCGTMPVVHAWLTVVVFAAVVAGLLSTTLPRGRSTAHRDR